MKTRNLVFAVLGTLIFALGGAVAAADTRGVSKTEIVLGTIQDLSGPLAAGSKQMRDGMQMRVDEINEKGGIAGRKIRLIVEDNGYDPKKAMLAAQKLANSDQVFAVLAHIGTMTNMAAMPVLFESGVINFMPASGARQMFEPAEKLKLAWMVPYFEEMRVVVPWVAKRKAAKKVGILYQDDEYGQEIMRGAEAGLKAMGLAFVETATYKRGATDFSSQIAKLKAADCDLVVLGTVLRESVGAIVEAHKTGFKPVFVGPTPVGHHLVPVLSKGAAEGLYAAASVDYPYAGVPGPVGDWATRYKSRFNEDPSVYAGLGYIIADLFGKAAEKAGANLTVDTLIKAMESNVFSDSVFGTPDCHITATKRLCSNQTGVAQVQNGRWVRAASKLSAD